MTTNNAKRALLVQSADPQLGEAIFAASDAPALRPLTISSQCTQLRMAASWLERSGMPATEITGLKVLVAPANFERLLTCCINHKGAANSTVAALASTLLKVAKHAGVSTPDELARLKVLRSKLLKRIKEQELRTESKGEVLIGQFNDERVMRALLALPSRTVARVRRTKRQGVQCAYSIQRAMILEIWLCAPLRANNMRTLRTDDFVKLTIDGVERIIVRVPADRVKNAVPLEHYLHDGAGRLLIEYLTKWRPMLTTSKANYLLPGRGDLPKTYACLRQQMVKYVEKGIGAQFHPHLIRRVVAKLILDADPSALEVARRQLGHTDFQMLQKVS